jgi:hypothetical protein
MLRRKSLKRFGLRYNFASKYAEDYDLYCRYSRFLQFANIPKSLHRYRIHKGSVSKKYFLQQRIEAREILYRHFSQLCNISFSQEEFVIHCSFLLPIDFDPAISIIQKRYWAERLMDWNRKEFKFNPEIFDKQAAETWQK